MSEAQTLSEENITVAIPPNDSPRSSAPMASMSFLGHLGELRRRLLYVVATLAVTTFGCFYFAPSLFELLRRPIAHLPNNHMIVLGPLEIFITYIKLAFLAGSMLSAPMVLWQIWGFVAPGLYPRERRFVLPFIFVGSLSFIGGAAFCFFLVLPTSFAYLIDMVPLTVEAHYSVSLYFSLVVQLILGFGLIFELPLILTLLGAANLISAPALGKFRKYWIVIATIIGGVLTPTPDPMTQMMMAIPLMIFFELGIVGVRLVQRNKTAVPQGASL